MARAEADVAGAELLDAVGEAQLARRSARRLRSIFSSMGVRLFGLAEDVHLHLVELVAALDAAHIAPGAHLLAPEAGRVGGVVDAAGRLRPGSRPCAGRSAGTSAVGTIHRSSSWSLYRLSANLGSCPAPNRVSPLTMKGSVFLGVALADVQVEHPGDQRALQARAGAAEHVEARAGHLDAALEVDDAQRRAQVPVRFGLEVELRDLADRAQDDILVLVLADRACAGRGVLGMVASDRRSSLVVDLAQLARPGGDAVADQAHGVDLGLALGGVLHLPDLLRDGVALGFERFHLAGSGRGAARPAPGSGPPGRGPSGGCASICGRYQVVRVIN